jgi:hypothetical protein
MPPLRIACDLDGTLADMESVLQREAEQLFGAGIDVRASRKLVAVSPSPDVAPAAPGTENGADDAPIAKRPLTRDEQRRLWMRVCAIDDFWTTLDEIEPGSVARFGALAKQHGWEVLFLTRRPATVGAPAQVQTQRWLHERGFEWPSVFVVKGSRGRVADALALHAVIDDLPENAMDVAMETKARAILVWREGFARLSPAAATMSTVVPSFGAALDLLEEMSAPVSRTQRLMRRVRAAMGI